MSPLSRLASGEPDMWWVLDMMGELGDIAISANSARNGLKHRLDYFPEMISREYVQETITEIETSLTKLKSLL